MNQQSRLLAYLRDHPACSSLDIVRDLRILNTTGRISDLRSEGHTVDAHRGADGVWRFRLVEAPEQLTAAL